MTPNPNGIKMSRAERHAQVKCLKDAGLTFREIADYLGVATSTVTSAYYDPTGTGDRARREKYKGKCVDCGGPTGSSYHDGRKTAERCMECRHAYDRTVERRLERRFGSSQTWTDRAIFASLRRVAVDGRVTVAMYDAAYALAEPGSMPSRPLIGNRFNTWNEAVEAAGLHPGGAAIKRERITADGCWLAVEECVAELGHVPTYREYEEWARRVGGPSGTLVRARIGSWIEVVEALSGKELAVAA